jgi:hypothetical protein
MFLLFFACCDWVRLALLKGKGGDQGGKTTICAWLFTLHDELPFFGVALGDYRLEVLWVLKFFQVWYERKNLWKENFGTFL